MVSGTSEGINNEGPWPACIGMSGERCRAMIASMANDLEYSNIFIVNQDSFVTMDFRTDRVRIFVDDDGIVVRTPSRG